MMEIDSLIAKKRVIWMMNHIQDAFDLNNQRNAVNEFFRKPKTQEELKLFFKGEGKAKILIYNQPRTGLDEYEAGEMQRENLLYISNGEDEKLTEKAVYFLRRDPNGGKLDLESIDGKVLFGEIHPNALEQVKMVISNVFDPFIRNLDEDDWGQCDKEQKDDFLNSYSKFNKEMISGLNSLTESMELCVVDEDILEEYKNRKEENKYYEMKFSEWLKKFDDILNPKEKNDRYAKQDKAPGPDTELTYWRKRLQSLTLLSELTKSNKTFTRVKNIVCNQKNKKGGDENSSSLADLYRSYDNSLTEKLNEAKDNVKYLVTLEKFIEPLKYGTPEEIIETLPALMNAVKMIHTIARYYKTSEKLTNLFVKITNQMITNCKNRILDVDPDKKHDYKMIQDRIWERDPETLIKILNSCIDLCHKYKTQYDDTKTKSAEFPKSRHWDFDDNTIFGKFEKFIRRVRKLIDIFSVIQQFRALEKHNNLEGMDKLTSEFKKKIDSFKAKPHDILDVEKMNFDKNFVDLMQDIQKLDENLQGFIENNFSKFKIISYSLKLLKKLKSILKSNTIINRLESKYETILQNYGSEIEGIIKRFDEDRLSPPIIRNMPPDAGKIIWVRHLFTKLNGPIEEFPSNMITHKDMKRYVDKFNLVGKNLIVYEIYFTQSWSNDIERAKACLQTPLLVIKEDGNRKSIKVNFEKDIQKLIREAKALDREGIGGIPESAKIILLQEEKFKTYYYELDFIKTEYERILGLIKPIMKNILSAHIEDLDLKLRPGMSILTWTSMNIDGFIQNVQEGLAKLEQLIITVNDIIDNRIENNLKLISKVILVMLPKDGKPMSLNKFVDSQKDYIEERAEFLICKNIEIERAVDDLLNVIMRYPLDQHLSEGVDKKAAKTIKGYYFWYLYQALLNSTQNSLNAMKNRVCGKRSAGDKTELKPFFEVDVKLEGGQVSLDPSLKDIQTSINRAATAVLSCSKKLLRWDQLDQKEKIPADQKQSFYKIIAQDKEIVKVILLLTGSIEGTKNKVKEFKQKFELFEWLWKDSISDSLDKFTATNPQLQDYERELKKFSNLENEIDEIEGTKKIGAMSFKTDLLNQGLKDKVKEWKTEYSKNLHNKARGLLTDLSDNTKQLSQRLSKEVIDINSLGLVMGTIEEVRNQEATVDLKFDPVLDMYNLLDNYLQSVASEREEAENRQNLKKDWEDLIKKSQAIQRQLQTEQAKHLKVLKKNVKHLVNNVKDFKGKFDDQGPKEKGISPKEASDRLNYFESDYNIKKTTYNTNFIGETLFGLEHQEYPELTQIKSEIDYLSKLYELYNKVNTSTNNWEEEAWEDINAAKISDWEDQIQKYFENCNKLPSGLKGWQAFKDLRKKIDSYKNVLPFVRDLQMPYICNRHWEQICEHSGKQLNYKEKDNFYFKELIEADLLSFMEELEDIISSAKKERKIEQSKDEIRQYWENCKFEFKPWGNRKVLTLSGDSVELINERLDEDIGTLAGVSAMKQVGPFKPEIQTWQKNLGEIHSTLTLWMQVQVLWSNLEAVFSGGDIAKSLKQETKKFKKIDKEWKKNVMEKAKEQEKVKACCQNDIIKSTLPGLRVELETCQKGLEKYLEEKRQCFPRFYFVSESVLLKFLSQGSEPESIQDDFDKLFDSVKEVDFFKGEKTKKSKGKKEMSIVKIIDSYGDGEWDKEFIELENKVICKGNIEHWLLELEKQMQETIKFKIYQAYTRFVEPKEKLDVRMMLKECCAQVSLMGVQMRWTKLIQDKLDSGQNLRSKGDDPASKIHAILNDLTDMCREELPSKMIRVKYETIVTICVYLNQQVSKIKVKNSKSFEWQKYTRLYWRKKKHGSECIISITDWDAKHSYEYLGVQMRLCITPLTDRCYITLAQAMSMHYGGSPAGPAGTGKTETVKDMGRTLGIYVIVTNCGPEQTYTDTAKLFKGLCQSGLWGCFDEFNRIILEVLSVVAMQVESINSAKKLGLGYFSFPDEPRKVKLVMTCGYFITMNPTYSGRQQLPENLKVLFRGVTMMVPNREIIIQVKLAAQGYKNFEILAAKFNVLYALCEQQLSVQNHYDFGLRNILSILRTAGTTLREDESHAGLTDEAHILHNETKLLKFTLNEMNLSKLVSQDVPLFTDLLEDTFPDIKIESNPPEDIKKALLREIERNKLIAYPSWVSKVLQVYASVLVRHGNVVMGPVGAGKSTILSTLAGALEEATNSRYKITRLNPKSFTAQEFIGVKNISGEWTKGIFPEIFREANFKSNKRDNKPTINWVVCDGPVDSLWIENLNTVLDDNKVLTLPNGDRIFMRDNCKLWFEVEDLNNASPATVSRCGQIYISPNDLGYAPIISGWVKQRTKDDKDGFKDDIGLTSLKATADKLFSKNSSIEILEVLNKYFLKLRIIDEVKLKTREHTVMPLQDCLMVTMCLNLLNGILHPVLTKKNSGLKMEDFEVIVLYAVMWAVGGTFENEGRMLVQDFLKDNGAPLPKIRESENIFEYEIERTREGKFQWAKIEQPNWTPPKDINFSRILMPTIDSYRADSLISYISYQPYSSISRKSCLLLGGPGTAKTSSVLMYASKFDSNKMLFHRINFSSATQPIHFQTSIDSVCDYKIQKGYGPKDGKQMTCFVDDFSMPEVNEWGDQITLEIVRQLMEDQGFYLTDKNERGTFRYIFNMRYIAAMLHPTGGRNSIPNRLKRQFFIFNMILSDKIDQIFNPILKEKYKAEHYNQDVNMIIDKIGEATISLWKTIKTKKKPTPSKFHYVFNLRDVSRVFKGFCQVKKKTIMSCSSMFNKEITPELFLVALWRHECERVFIDKLIENKDKYDVLSYLNEISKRSFEHLTPEIEKHLIGNLIYFCDFLREDTFDDDGITVLEEAEKIYEGMDNIDKLRMRCLQLLGIYNASPANQQRKMDLVLFDDALSHLIRISRIIQMPRSSALLVGVGGSGRQSLTRLAAFTGKQKIKQIVLTKGFNENNLKECIKDYFDLAGHKNEKVTFIMTDAEVKEEEFLEYINMVLSTGEIPGLLQKDDKEVWLGDVRNEYQKKYKIKDEVSQTVIYDYFVNRLRDNLHVVLCFSPIGTKFRERARKFPALFNECSIDWFLPWPAEALNSVSSQQIKEFPELRTNQKTRDEDLPKWMSNLHNSIVRKCEEYYLQFRRNVYVTPKSYLSFLGSYKRLYKAKYKTLEVAEENYKNGLKQIDEAKKDISNLEAILKVKSEEIKEEQKELDKDVAILREKQAIAKNKEAEVTVEKEKIQEEAKKIGKEKAICEVELGKALPALIAAETAAKKIDSSTIASFKGYIKTKENMVSAPVKYLTEAMNIIFYQKVRKDIKIVSGLKANKKATNEYEFLDDSWSECKFCLNAGGLRNEMLKRALKGNEDLINEEILELIKPYTDLKETLLNEDDVRGVAAPVLSVREWVVQIETFSKNTRKVKPMKAAVKEQEEKLAKAKKELQNTEDQLAEIKAQVAKLNAGLREKKAKADAKQEEAKIQKNKIKKAMKLITSLADEESRWSHDAEELSILKEALVGNIALATAFISYCGPFNAQFRDMIANDLMIKELERLNIPYSSTIYDKLTQFLVDETKVGQWNIDGLPKDTLSIQNGIMIESSDRYPLLIDPQLQGSNWLKNTYTQYDAELGETGIHIINSMADKKFRRKLLHCLEEGEVMIIEGIVSEVDPILDPILEKQYVETKKGKRLTIGEDKYSVSDDFKLYMTCILSIPKFSPELCAKTTVIDFTVTITGLEQQLLSIALSQEMSSLEQELKNLNRNVTEKKKQLKELDDQLLNKLSNSSDSDKSLIDDDDLVAILNKTKSEAKSIANQLIEAETKTKEITETTKIYKSVAVRGSVLYFCMIEIANVLWMYNSSLEQFLELYDNSIMYAEKNDLEPEKRVQNIVEYLTYEVFEYVNRGIFSRDQVNFLLMICFKILITDGVLIENDINLFLKAGALLDKKNSRPKPTGDWFPDDKSIWANILCLANHSFGTNGDQAFVSLPEEMSDSKSEFWKKFYASKNPEVEAQKYMEETRFQNERLKSFLKFCLVRCCKPDRTIIAALNFVKEILKKDEFVEPPPEDIKKIHGKSSKVVPILYLLSKGADPTQTIDDYASDCKKEMAKISLGQGQEPKARVKIHESIEKGSWVLLQNCHLGLGFMQELDENLKDSDFVARMHDEFRIWMTCEPVNNFPLGLLQRAVKVTNEPPIGMRAGMKRTMKMVVTPDVIEKIDHRYWRNLTFILSFMHSVVQERRKFGALGWCVPYEFNYSDLEASMTYIEKYLTEVLDIQQGVVNNQNQNPNLAYDVIKTMVCDIQYGGKIHDNLDRELMTAFGNKFLKEQLVNESNGVLVDIKSGSKKNDNPYKIPSGSEHQNFVDAIEDFFAIDTPELFFLHPNADVTFRMGETRSMINTLMETRPKDSGGSDGEGRDQVVQNMANNMITKVAYNYPDELIIEKISKLQGPKDYPSVAKGEGMTVPLNIFLMQELQRMHIIVNIVRKTFQDIDLAVKGQIIMTPQIVNAIDALFDRRVPHNWLYDTSDSEISWMKPNLRSWFDSLITRNERLEEWMNMASNKRPKFFNLDLFFNPQGFLTSMKQEVLRIEKHKPSNAANALKKSKVQNEEWSLDSMDYKIEVLTRSKDMKELESKGGYPEGGGVWIEGLWIEGADLTRESMLTDAGSKNLVFKMPIVHVSAKNSGIKKGEEKKDNEYDCPVYKYPRRTDFTLIFRIPIKCAGQGEGSSKWKLAGVACLASNDR